MRTTIDIDDPILKEVKSLQKKENKSLGRIVSDLLAQSLRERKQPGAKQKRPRWIAQAMGARVDVRDKDALYATMEREDSSSHGESES